MLSSPLDAMLLGELPCVTRELIVKTNRAAGRGRWGEASSYLDELSYLLGWPALAPHGLSKKARALYYK